MVRKERNLGVFRYNKLNMKQNLHRIYGIGVPEDIAEDQRKERNLGVFRYSKLNMKQNLHRIYDIGVPEDVAEDLYVAPNRSANSAPGDESVGVASDVTADFQVVSTADRFAVGRHTDGQIGGSYSQHKSHKLTLCI